VKKASSGHECQPDTAYHGEEDGRDFREPLSQGKREAEKSQQVRMEKRLSTISPFFGCREKETGQRVPANPDRELGA
jgi:hypothetical protein